MRTIPLFLNRYKGIYKSETRNVPGLITQDSFRKFIITEIRLPLLWAFIQHWTRPTSVYRRFVKKGVNRCHTSYKI